MSDAKRMVLPSGRVLMVRQPKVNDGIVAYRVLATSDVTNMFALTAALITQCCTQESVQASAQAGEGNGAAPQAQAGFVYEDVREWPLPDLMMLLPEMLGSGPVPSVLPSPDSSISDSRRGN